VSTLNFDADAAKRIDAIYATPDVVAQRQATLDTLGLQPGERAVDLGVGPGYLAASMAELVGAGGHVSGIDISENMVGMAQQRCGEYAQVDVRVGDVTGLPYPDGAFDVGVSTQVLEYVPDVDAALLEVRRVLRPGGRAAIVDTDWDSIVWASSHDELMRRILTTWDQHLVDPHLPRTISGRLREAGLRTLRVDVIPIVNRHYNETTYSFGMSQLVAEFVTDRDGLTAGEVEQWLEGHRALDATENYFFSLNRYLFLAEASG
jgi:ubiquinone/menaquinone biosynthesis C-methylase UbiE